MWVLLLAAAVAATLWAGCTQTAEPTPNVQATVAAMLATQVASQPTATPAPSPTPTPTPTPVLSESEVKRFIFRHVKDCHDSLEAQYGGDLTVSYDMRYIGSQEWLVEVSADPTNLSYGSWKLNGQTGAITPFDSFARNLAGTLSRGSKCVLPEGISPLRTPIPTPTRTPVPTATATATRTPTATPAPSYFRASYSKADQLPPGMRQQVQRPIRGR